MLEFSRNHPFQISGEAVLGPLAWGIHDEGLAFLAALRISRALVVVSLLGAAGFLFAFFLEEREPGIAELAVALGDRRLIEPRLTGGFRHGPCQPVTAPRKLIPEAACSDLPPSGTEDLKRFRRLLREIESRASRGGDAPSLHARGVAYLLGSKNERAAHVSVATLEKAAERTPSDARILNDLAAAYFVRAQRKDDPQDLIRALDTVARAREVNPELPEALFNLALIEDRLYLTRSASRAWNEFLDVDEHSGWADDARRHLEILRRPTETERWQRALPSLEAAALRGDDATVRRIVAISPQAAREYAVEDLLGGWGEAVLRQDRVQALSKLKTTTAIGAALVAITGDPFVAKAAEPIGKLDSEAAGVAAQGHKAYWKASRLFEDQRAADAAPHFRQAERSLSIIGSPVALWAKVGVGAVALYEAKHREALVLHEDVALRADQEGFISLSARSRWCIGLAQIRQGRFSESQDRYQQAANLFKESRETENWAAVTSLLAENLRFLGQRTAAWQYRLKAVSLLSEAPSHLRLHNLMWEGGKAAQEGGQLEAAVLLHGEGVLIAEEARSSSMLAEALRFRSRTLAAMDRLGEAIADLEIALRNNARMLDRISREKVAADIDLAEGDALWRMRPLEAIGHFSEAIAWYSQRSVALELFQAHLGRALASLQIGLIEEAEADLNSAIRLFEANRVRLRKSNHRSSYTETAREVYDEMIYLQWRERGASEAALLFSERNKYDAVSPEAVPRLSTISEYLSVIPEGSAFIEYALVKDRVFAWVLQRGGLEAFEREVDPVKLRALVERFLEKMAFQVPEEEIAEESSQLYDLLIAPAISFLPPGCKLHIIPDKFMYGIPFAALRDPINGRYLVEDHQVSLYPSLRFLLRKRSDVAPLGIQRILLFGSPPIDNKLFPSLPDLPGAWAEIEEIGKKYENSVKFRGRAATKEALLRTLTTVEIFHFSGHALLNAGQSYIILASSREQGNDLLSAEDFEGLSLRNLRLVVLAACSTLGPGGAHGTSLAEFALPFLNGGSLEVVGSVLAVEDKRTSTFLTVFHDHYKRMGSAAAALRKTQIQLLGSSSKIDRSPSSWAMFQVIGSTL